MPLEIVVLAYFILFIYMTGIYIYIYNTFFRSDYIYVCDVTFFGSQFISVGSRLDHIPFCLDHNSFRLDHNSFRLDHISFCLDRNSFRLDHSSFRLDHNSFHLDQKKDPNALTCDL